MARDAANLNSTAREDIEEELDNKSRFVLFRKKTFVVCLQVANAANYGAIAAILYSDPADYALQGGEPENTYPNTAWLPASGVQRGSLYTMPGNGDPQTPGIAALNGTFRRSFNDSELPPIPAHPMGYGDAIHFHKRIKGKVCIFQFSALFCDCRCESATTRTWKKVK